MRSCSGFPQKESGKIRRSTGVEAERFIGQTNGRRNLYKSHFAGLRSAEHRLGSLENPSLCAETVLGAPVLQRFLEGISAAEVVGQGKIGVHHRHAVGQLGPIVLAGWRVFAWYTPCPRHTIPDSSFRTNRSAREFSRRQKHGQDLPVASRKIPCGQARDPAATRPAGPGQIPRINAQKDKAIRNSMTEITGF